MLTYFLHSDKKGEWYWTVIETGTGKDRTVARSTDTYFTKEDCEKDIDLIKAFSANARTMEFRAVQ